MALVNNKIREIPTIAKDVDVNQQDATGTALHWAAGWNKPEAIPLLLEAGVDPTARNEKGLTALHLAAWAGNAVVIQTLIGAGVDPLLKDSRNDTALHVAAHSQPKSWPAVVPRNEIGNTANAIQQLIDAGVDPNARGFQDQTALHAACRHRNADVIQPLVDAGVDPNHQEMKGVTALMEAIARQDPDVIQAIMNIDGIDPNKQNIIGFTAFHYAAKRGIVQLIQPLIALGADPTIKDDEERTAYDVAKEYGKEDFAHRLISVTTSKATTVAQDVQQSDAHKEMIQTLIEFHFTQQLVNTMVNEMDFMMTNYNSKFHNMLTSKSQLKQQ